MSSLGARTRMRRRLCAPSTRVPVGLPALRSPETTSHLRTRNLLSMLRRGCHRREESTTFSGSDLSRSLSNGSHGSRTRFEAPVVQDARASLPRATCLIGCRAPRPPVRPASHFNSWIRQRPVLRVAQVVPAVTSFPGRSLPLLGLALESKRITRSSTGSPAGESIQFIPPAEPDGVFLRGRTPPASVVCFQFSKSLICRFLAAHSLRFSIILFTSEAQTRTFEPLRRKSLRDLTRYFREERGSGVRAALEEFRRQCAPLDFEMPGDVGEDTRTACPGEDCRDRGS